MLNQSIYVIAVSALAHVCHILWCRWSS